MKKLLFFAIALMFAFASCTNEALNEVVEEPIVPESTAAPVLYASFESNEIESKAGLPMTVPVTMIIIGLPGIIFMCSRKKIYMIFMNVRMLPRGLLLF